MATSEITSVVENQLKEKASSIVLSNSGSRKEISTTKDVHKSSEKGPTIEENLDPKGPFIPQYWNIVFIVSCVFAVFLDPLFLYIPIIHDDMKCLRLDKNLQIAALTLRSITDLCYVLNIFFQVRSENCSGIAKILWRSYILIDILAVLPLPQVVIVIFFSKMRGLGTFNTRKLMNFLVIVQYVPRVLRIYLSCKEYSKKFAREETPIWLKGVLNFFMYILVSHVLGGFWYFFSVQRITTCWQYACRNENGCDPKNFDCHDHHTLRNTTLLDELCPIDPANAKLFDFGIYLDIFQFNILGSTNYLDKFSNCFWWGLRNLSSLGSNLQPSISTWENLFAIFISIIGLLLFVYLIGNVQTYMQLDTSRIETHRWKMRIEQKMEKKGQEVELWLSKNGVPLHKKSEIMVKVLVELKENKDVDVENILSILPLDLQKSIESYMKLSRLKQVPLLQNMDEEVLREISVHLKPIKYTKDDIIIREDEQLQMVLFIVAGLVMIEKRDCSSYLEWGEGKLYGEKLLAWPSLTSFPDVLPIANESARAIGDVEALILMATDMESVGSKFRLHFFKEITLRTDSHLELLTCDWETMLRKVPKLETMDRQVLKEIFEHLRPMSYSSINFVEENRPLPMMIFVTRGILYITRSGYDQEYDHDKQNEYGWKSGQRPVDFFGEQLLDWVFDRSFPALLPLSPCDVQANDIDVLILMATDLATIASKFRSHFSKITLPTAYDLHTTVGLTVLKKEPSIFQNIDDHVLIVMCQHLKLMSYSVDNTTYILRENEPLEMMFFLLDGSNVSMQYKSMHRFVRHIGEFHGTELVHWVTNWASHTTFPAKLPFSSYSAKITGDVEVLALTADDLKSVVSQFRSNFMKQTTLPLDSRWKLLTFDPLTRLRKVPVFEQMDEQVLQAICECLKPVTFSDTSPNAIGSFGKLDKMFFIVGGLVSLTKYVDPKFYRYSGNYCGEQLLEWVSDSSFPDTLPDPDNINVKAVGDVEALVLTADDLVSVVSKFKSHFIKEVASAALSTDSH